MATRTCGDISLREEGDSSGRGGRGRRAYLLRHEEGRARRGAQHLGGGRQRARRAPRVEHVHVRLLYVCKHSGSRSRHSRERTSRGWFRPHGGYSRLPFCILKMLETGGSGGAPAAGGVCVGVNLRGRRRR